MAIDTSGAGLVAFLQNNTALLSDVGSSVKSGTETLSSLVDQLDKNRKDTDDLLQQIQTMQFDVAQAPDVKAQQKDLLGQLAVLTDQIKKFADIPELTTPLYAQQALIYVTLANTFITGTVRKIITFTPVEVTQLRTLLQQAALDARQRQQWADVLTATVQVVKVALAIAGKVAAA